MKGCAKIREQLSAYIDQGLTAEETKSVEQHIAACASCASALADLRKVVAHLQALEQIEPPAWMTQKVMAKVRDLQGAGEKRGFFSWLMQPLYIKVPIGALATAMLAVTTYLIIHSVVPEMPVKPTGQIRETPESAAGPKAAANEKSKTDIHKGHSELKIKTAERSGPESEPAASYAPVPKDYYKSAAPARVPEMKAGAVAPSEATGGYQKRAGVSKAMKTAPSRGYSIDAGEISAAKTEEQAYRPSSATRSLMAEGAPVSLHMSAADPMAATKKVADGLRQFGGKDIKVDSMGGRLVVTGLLHVQWLQPFYEKLKTIGTMQEKTAPMFADVSSVKITVEIGNAK